VQRGMIQYLIRSGSMEEQVIVLLGYEHRHLDGNVHHTFAFMIGQKVIHCKLFTPDNGDTHSQQAIDNVLCEAAMYSYGTVMGL